jgi:lipopolysaccharide/colanic/teichoic acid biosynthesis glycosyltransferase
LGCTPNGSDREEGWQRRRLSVRPGLTCIWQVSGRNQNSFKECMYLDMRYIDSLELEQRPAPHLQDVSRRADRTWRLLKVA